MTSFEFSDDEGSPPARVLGDTPRRGASRIGWLRIIASAISLAAGAYVIVTSLVMVISGWSPVPFWDHWDLLIFSPKQVLSGWLFAQDNEHRSVIPKLILAIDTLLFAGSGKFAWFCNIAFLAGLFVFFVRIAHRHISRCWTDTLWITGVVATLLFSAMQFENLLWAIQSGFLGIGLATAGCFAFLVLGRRGLPSLAVAIGFEAIALYSMANGILVALLAMPLALWAGRSKTQLAVLAVAFIILFGSYLYGYVTPGHHSDPLRSLFDPGVIVYVAVQLGAPIGLPMFDRKYPSWLAFGIGFGGFGFVLFTTMTIILLRRRREASGVQLLLLGLATFAVGTAVLTGLGRIKFGFEQALSSRYTSVVLLFWVSLTLLIVSVVWQRRPNLRLPILWLTVPCLMAIAFVQPSFVQRGGAFVSLRHEAAPALLANVYDGEVLRRIYPEPLRVAEHAAKLRAQHLALFADPWSNWLGTPLADHVRLSEAGECRGAIDALSPSPTSARAEGRLTGWASSLAGQAVDRIVVADLTGKVVGYGLGGFTAEAKAPPNSSWHGYFAACEGDLLTVYALIDQDRAACPLGFVTTTIDVPASLIP